MRDIKFRAWDKKLKKYVSERPFNIYGEIFFLFGFGNTNDDRNRNDIVEYANEIVFEQYTGLKDSNGREIYEGDIIRESHHANGHEFDIANCVIRFESGAFVFDFCQLNNGRLGVYPAPSRKTDEYRRHMVVGNINEHAD